MKLVTMNRFSQQPLSIYISTENDFSKDNNSMFKIIFVKSGTGIFRINDTVIVIMAPAVLCINEQDRLQLEKMNSIKTTTIYFCPSMVNDILTIDNIRSEKKEVLEAHGSDYFYLYPFIDRTEVFKIILEINYTIAERLSKLISFLEEEVTFSENLYWHCRSRSFLLEILFLISHISTGYSKDNPVEIIQSTSELNDIILYLHANYPKRIIIKDIENVFHVNRTTLANKFREATGTSIKNYLIKLRIKISMLMLRDTALPVSEIAYRVGFQDITHFSRMFKKHACCLPSEYQKNMLAAMNDSV